jgi:hypothetical protein
MYVDLSAIIVLPFIAATGKRYFLRPVTRIAHASREPASRAAQRL